MGICSKAHMRTLKKMSTLHPDFLVGCMCPHCGGVFIPWQMEGDLNNRLCPKCRQRITPEDYDVKARHLIGLRSEFKVQIEEAHAPYERAKKILSYFDFILLRPFKKFAARFLAKDLHRYNSLIDQLKSNERKIIFAAKDRYYVGEFFQHTHIPLVREENGREITIRPFFDKEGKWHLPYGPTYNQGFIAEQAVFDVLFRESLDPGSLLYGARLAPNLYFPRKQKEGNAPTRFWDQVDLVLFTRNAAFVIEIKGHRASIVANAPFKTIYSSVKLNASQFNIRDTKNPALWSERERSALTQNSAHAVSFNELCTAYSYKSVFEQCIFVNPVSWKSNSRRFVENVNVSFLSDDHEVFLEPLKNVLCFTHPILTQDELESVADSFIVKYGDLTQTCANMHVERIKKLQELHEKEDEILLIDSEDYWGSASRKSRRKYS